MTVFASASVTLACVVDVSAVYRYYLLQPSTMATPSAPESYPPTGAWMDSEPGYVSGSTNSLYTVDLTIFSDGSYAYSAVSLSSSYEAAKEAWNKAQAAGDTAQEAIDTANGVATYTSEQITQVTQDSQKIIFEALAEYATTSDLERLTEKVSSQLAVMPEKITIEFNEIIKQEIADLGDDWQQKYDNIAKYFDFSGEGLVIGEKGNQITLKIDNDRISFIDGGLEVAYITSQTLVITKSTFLKSIMIGNFEWLPRRNGNLSLMVAGE